MNSLHPLLDNEPGLIKVCQYPAIDEHGQQLVEFLHHPDQLHHSYMDKVAAPFLPAVREYIDRLKPDANSIYALVNALGAYEYWSSNTNGDAFEEEMLIHRGPVWGYETFQIYARPFMHHANKQPNARAFGSVELSAWNPNMHRIELVCRLDRKEAVKVNATRVIDKIDHGELPETSMGTKVPYDLSSITTDWETYRKALATFDPGRHRHPGVAALIYHKTVRPIRGLSITRDDYDEYCQNRMNEILPDGRKVFVYNPFPRFFDISFVFIGAEKQSKMMAKLASAMGRAMIAVPANYTSTEIDQPRTHKGFEKVAGVDFQRSRERLRSLREKKASQKKLAEIIKDVVPSQFMSRAVPILEDREPDLSREALDRMSECSLNESLSTPTMMGITLKPREFQRIVVCRLGRGDMADRLDQEGKIFRDVDDVDKSISIGPGFINRLLAGLLKGYVGDRSAFGPPLARRMMRITIVGKPAADESPAEELEDKLLDKVAAAYNGYREQVIEKIAEMSNELERYPDVKAEVLGRDETDIFAGREKLAAGINPKLLVGAIPATYLLSALARRKVRSSAWTGKAPGLLTEFLGDHPHLAATAVGLTALKASGSKIPDKILKGALDLGKRLATG